MPGAFASAGAGCIPTVRASSPESTEGTASMVARTGQISAPGWTFSGSIPASVQPMAFTGRYRSARRAIDPPRIELSPVAAASRYEIAISPLTRPDLVLAAGSDIPAVDLAPVWDELPQ